MENLRTFLIIIGSYNILGALIMFALLNDNLAKRFSKICELFTATYETGNAGSLWLCWAAVLNFVYGCANVAAIRWGPLAQKDLMIANIFLYAFFLILTFLALRSKNYSRGMWMNVPLFAFWLIWGTYVYNFI